MRKTFKYIYKDPEGRQTTLIKSITDKMESRDDHKKEAAAGYFTDMLKRQYKDFIYPVVVRNIQEV